jgi:hypothetical protein
MTHHSQASRHHPKTLSPDLRRVRKHGAGHSQPLYDHPERHGPAHYNPVHHNPGYHQSQSDHAWRRWPSAPRGALHAVPRGAFRSPLVAGILALLWLLVRSGASPRRLTYPCQRAAMSTAVIALGFPLAGLLVAARRRLRLAAAELRAGRLAAAVALAAAAALAAVLAAGFAGYLPEAGGYLGAAFSGQALLGPRYPASEARYLGTKMESPASYRAAIYDVTDCQVKPAGTRFIGLDNLIALMGRQGLKFYRSGTASLAGGPDGIIAPDDVVVVKINYQWTQRGGTNVDVLSGLVSEIVRHPDGFTGEIVICENGQFIALENFDRSENNAQDKTRSPHDVVLAFQALGHNVSHYDWTLVRADSVGEYSEGDVTDGYVLSDYDPEAGGRVSYPKFRTASGTYISLKHGVWDPVTETYSRERLKFINVPVLKSHHAVYGATASVKHYMGVVTDLLGTNSHNAVATGLMGSLIAEIALADLNIVDAIYINANPNSGPATGYTGATRWKELAASTDPVALDIWSVKHILVPGFLSNGFTPPWPEPSADPDDSTSDFRVYLDNSMYELVAAGETVTNDTTCIDAWNWSGRAGDFDQDADIDSLDYDQFALCYTGPGGGPVGPECAAADFDGDGDVDCDDWRNFEYLWTGPGDLPALNQCSAGAIQPPEGTAGPASTLGEAAPNPATGGTSVRFTVGSAGRVKLSVLDATGRTVRQLADRVMPAGEHSAVWDGANAEGRAVAGGVYFMRLEAPGFAGSKKVAVSR